MLHRFSRSTIFLGLGAFLITTIYLLRPFRFLQTSFSSAREEDKSSFFLTQKECDAAFPALFNEDGHAGGPVWLKRLPDDTSGLVQGRIKDGKLYIVSAYPDNALHRVPAILHSLHRAIITSPVPLPNTIFALNINDEPRENSWSFARSDDEFTRKTPFLMPHYSSWSWPHPSLGPLDEALLRISYVEGSTRWKDKIDKAVWRGTPWFNPDWRMGLRPMLLEVAGGREWADVEQAGQGQNNSISAEGFCKYKYIVYAEGKTYSGRLPYHLACESIILTPPPTFLLHSTHLLRPVFSSLLPLTSSSSPHPKAHPNHSVHPPIESYPIANTSTTWPISYPPSQANIIFVHPDWADLEDVIIYLRANPDIAAGIAARQRRLWVGGGLLSEGAEACSWRRLIRDWASSVKIDESEWEEGMRWETFAILGKVGYD